eukprot:GHVU01006069.1.p1 GENE.GHVU01006069.1~~GHVU01006069.1.p1  ORF type:complete len:138 (+),score=4.91 GHVU01006069.1:52-465(+)
MYASSRAVNTGERVLVETSDDSRSFIQSFIQHQSVSQSVAQSSWWRPACLRGVHVSRVCVMAQPSDVFGLSFESRRGPSSSYDRSPTYMTDRPTDRPTCFASSVCRIDRRCAPSSLRTVPNADRMVALDFAPDCGDE